MTKILPPTRRTRAIPGRRPRVRFRPGVDALEGRALLSHVYHVTDGASLAAAVQSANGESGSSEIILDRAGTYNVPSALTISAQVTITGKRDDRPDLYVIQPASGVTDRVLDVTGAQAVTIRGVTIQGGSTTGDGGGIDDDATGAVLTLDDDIIQNNTAGDDGGGVAVDDGAALTITDTAVLNNTAGGDGGGASFNASSQAGKVVLTTTTFAGNAARGSTGMGDGGGILVQATTPPGAPSDQRPPRVDLNVSGVNFLANTSAHDGGGLWANDVTRIDANGVVGIGNVSVQDAGAFGDSVMHLNSASFRFTDGYVAANQVTGPGSGTTPDAGGVCFDFMAGSGAPTPTGSVTATLTGTTFVANSVAGAGGGAFVRDEATQTSFNATVTGNSFEGNRALTSNIASEESGAGGGLYIAGSAGSNQLTVSRNAYLGNTAATNGGGLYIELDSGRAAVNNSIFLGNQASDGGGAYVTGNTTAGTPGGTVVLSGDFLISNSATTDGGGLYVDSTGVANLVGDVIALNSAGTAGGGVFNDNGTVTVKRSIILFNTAPTAPDFAGPYTDLGGNTIG